MRKTLMMSVALLGMGTAGAFAQNTTTSGQTPAAPGASSQSVQPSNSLPSGAGNSVGNRAGNNLGTTSTGGTTPMATMPQGTMPQGTMPQGTMPQGTMTQGTMPQGAAGGSAMPMQSDMAGQPAMRRPGMARRMAGPRHARMMRGQRMNPAADAAAETSDGTAMPTSAYRGGASVPLSPSASNTTAANTRSTIAPRLPDPAAGSNSPEAYLSAAQRALASGRTGAAQEALERAETRLLSRSTDPSMAGSPDDSAMIQQIGAARRSLANRDTAGARSAIGMAMGRPGA